MTDASGCGTVDRVVFYSGGIASFIAAKRLVERHGRQRIRLLFTDTKYEHEDLYRFLDETTAYLGVELVREADGRNPWEVFRDVKFLGNSRIDPCSKILKRQVAKRWIKSNYPNPDKVVLYLGLNHDEGRRLERSKGYWSPYCVESPLMDKPLLDKPAMLEECRACRIEPPELYELGFPHNNCGGFCIKAGQAHFRHLLRELPDKYQEAEAKEEEMRQMLGDVSILTETKGGQKKRLTLKQLRERSRDECNTFDWGGCGCFGDIPDDESVNSD